MSKRSGTTGRVIVIGLDGADPALVEKFSSEGSLPALGGLMRGGAFSRLRTTTPVHSAPAWAAFATGKNPGKTGVFSFLKCMPGGYRQEFVFSGDVAGEPIWRIANRHGKTAGVINVPMTFPIDRVDGYMLAGFPDPGYSFHPEELLGEIVEHIPSKWEPPKQVAGWDPCYRDDLVRDANCKNILLYMNEKKPVDLQVIVLGLIDRIQHRYWHCMDASHPRYTAEEAAAFGGAVRTAYEIIDGMVAEIAGRRSGGDTVFIISDHGFRPCSRSFHINSFLMREGYLTLLKSAAKPAEKTSVQDEILRRADWTRTKAFVVHEDLMTSAGIRINLRGREKKGVVGRGREYEELRIELKRKLLEFRDPATGKRFVENVHPREDVFNGNCLGLAPDLLVESAYRLAPEIEPDVLFSDIEPPGGGRGLQKKRFTGHHSPFGIFIACGGAISGSPGEVNMADVAPTVLRALGLPIPEDMDGRPLDIFSESFMKTHPVRVEPEAPDDSREYVISGTPEDDRKKALIALKGLGYLD